MVEKRPGFDALVRRAHLAEDLTLARHERVEPRGDAEEMQRSRVLVQPVDDAVERLSGHMFERGERLVLVDVRDVELGAVARREAHRIAERPREHGRVVERERHPLAQLDRRDVMREADERERHAKWLPASASRATITSAKPASATTAALRPRGRAATNPP